MNRQVYKHLFATYGRNPGQWFGFVTALYETFVVRVYVVIILAQVASNVAAGNITSAKHHTIQYVIIYLSSTIIGVIGELIAIRSENIQYQKSSIYFHEKLISKDMAFYRDNQTGYLASIFRQYLDSGMLLVRFWRGEALGVIVSLIVPAIVLLFIAPAIGLVAVAIVIVQVTYITWSSSKANKYRDLSHEIYRKVTGEVSDEITNIVAFKSSGVDGQAQDRIASLAAQETDAFWLRRKTNSLFDLPRGIITAAGTALSVYIIIDMTNATDPSSLGLIVLTLTYMFQISRTVASVPQLVVNHDDIVTKLYPTLDYLTHRYEEIRDSKSPRQLHIKHATIEFRHISFSYPSLVKTGNNVPVFEDLSITVGSGEQLGIVGLSGAGKSTLANLLLRFDEIQTGAITINGVNIKDVKQIDLRRNIAYVPQEPLLFHRTIRDNIAYYNDSATDEEVIEAAKAAHAHDFIQKLPIKYDTMVGERGIKLSGGQKQRVAIARAVLKKAPIILFDEATSALDSESEQIIQRALPKILGKQTALVIAHRLSTVARLDRIIVLHEGKIVEQGTHQQLLKLGGRYNQLWQKQTKS